MPEQSSLALISYAAQLAESLKKARRVRLGGRGVHVVLEEPEAERIIGELDELVREQRSVDRAA